MNDTGKHHDCFVQKIKIAIKILGIINDGPGINYNIGT